jgi:hypothetical protein
MENYPIVRNQGGVIDIFAAIGESYSNVNSSPIDVKKPLQTTQGFDFA